MNTKTHFWLGAFALAWTSIAAVAESSSHSAIQPIPRTDRGWQDRHKAINQKAAEAGEKAQVIFIGDSITQGWEGEGKAVWARYYTPRNAVNLGIGGDRTQHVLWRLDNGNLDGLDPKAAVVMIGTNNSNGEDNTPGQIVDGVTAIVKRLRDKLPRTKILLVAIFPRGENFTAQRGKLLQVNQVLRNLADEKNIFWIDFGHRFVNSDGLIPRELMPDYLHLTAKGYEIWAETIEGRLAKILGDAKGVAATSGVSLTGEWTMGMPGPDGNTIERAMVLKQEGTKVTGKYSRGEDRWLEIENGQINGNEFSWIIKRDRSSGGAMIYKISGKIEGGELKGTVKTEMDGEERTVNWTARKK